MTKSRCFVGVRRPLVSLAALAIPLVVPFAVGTSAEPPSMTNSLGMKLVKVPSGEFQMGAEEDPSQTQSAFPYCQPEWLAGESPRHQVRMTKSFWLGVYEVKLNQFLMFYHATKYKTDMEKDGQPQWAYTADGKLTPSKSVRPWAPGWKMDQSHPVVYVSWNDAVAFCEWLSQKDGRRYRLPTEAEWEYACRAGSTTRFSWGDEIDEAVAYGNVTDQDRRIGLAPSFISLARKDDEKEAKQIPFPFLPMRDGYQWSAPVGSFRPNAFGLYDMHGNVWEWCGDWYSDKTYETEPFDDPQGPATGKARVMRGGSFCRAPFFLRSACRGGDVPTARSYDVGFRVVCEE